MGDFRVHEDISQTGHYLAEVAIDDDGKFIITWNNRREGDWNIYAQRFNSDFTPIGPEFKVNDDELVGVEQKGDNVVMTEAANRDFAITCYDWRNSDPDVRLYGDDGNSTTTFWCSRLLTRIQWPRRTALMKVCEESRPPSVRLGRLTALQNLCKLN